LPALVPILMRRGECTPPPILNHGLSTDPRHQTTPRP
jgi:hypothetical protein